MSVLDTLITDRTQADADRVAYLNAKGLANMTVDEQNEWNSPMKGAYHTRDLNRIGEAINYLVTQLNSAHALPTNLCDDLGIAWDEFWYPETWFPGWDTITGVTGKTNWIYTNIPTPAQLAELLANVDTVTGAVTIPRALPASMDHLTVQGANEIERAMQAEGAAITEWERMITQLANNTAAAWNYSGNIYSGNGGYA